VDKLVQIKTVESKIFIFIYFASKWAKH